MFQTIAFLSMTLISVILLAGILVLLAGYLISRIRKTTIPKQLTRIKKTAAILLAAVCLNTGLVAISQVTASTPPIRDQSGKVIENSIAQLIQVQLNESKQWISLRGQDQSNPVLLFLAGGPGGTQMAAVRYELAALEEHFVVVSWDQPGSGKSYFARKNADITPETYLQDGHALTRYLCERFSQDKIYLVGESWGSALGIFLVERYPENYHALIGTAQMVDFAQTERMDYEKAMEIAIDKNDLDMIKKLETNGIPPYYGKDVTWKSGLYINYLTAVMMNNPDIHNPGYSTPRDIASSEYGLLDKINYAWGVISTFNRVYQQLYDIDMRKDFIKLEVPVYFFQGRHDLNAPPQLAQEYLAVLDAPTKEIVWFEHSGHSPRINERDKFVQELLIRFSQHNHIGQEV